MHARVIPNLMSADLSGADLSEAGLGLTIFVDVDLTETKGLDSCEHQAHSIVDLGTLERSKNVPISFCRGCGLPEALIDYLPYVKHFAEPIAIALVLAHAGVEAGAADRFVLMM